MEEATNRIERLVRVRQLCHSGAARSARLAAELSLSEVAKVIDTAPSTVYRWETCERKPRGDAALRYEQLLGRLLQPSRARRSSAPELLA